MDLFRNTAQPDEDWWATLWPDPADTLRRLGIDGGTLADVACGDGYFTVPAADLVDRVYAVDLDADLLGDLEDRARAAAVENVDPIQGDARTLPSLLPEPVETVLFANTFHGVDDGTAFAETVRGALTDDGRFVVVNWHDRPPQGYHRSWRTPRPARGPPHVAVSDGRRRRTGRFSGGRYGRSRTPPLRYRVQPRVTRSERNPIRSRVGGCQTRPTRLGARRPTRRHPPEDSNRKPGPPTDVT